MEGFEWVSNTRGPAPGEDREIYDAWRSQFVEGPPEPTDHHTAEQLTNMGLVGLYRPVA